MPPRPTQGPQTRTTTHNRSTPTTSQNNNYQQNTRRVRDIKPSTIDNITKTGCNQSEENESINPESTCYIRETMEDWITVHLVN